MTSLSLQANAHVGPDCQVCGCALAGPLVEVQELEALEPANGHRQHAAWHMQAVSRPVGENSVGIVAWQLTLKSPECPQGRQVRTARSMIMLSKSQTLSKHRAPVGCGPRKQFLRKPICLQALSIVVTNRA